ncbi:MAG: peptide chain release factor-like protein [Pirellulales bacterium]|nr:peptide chain release factor-like protein [Pirellulales bacterium]
MRWHVAKGGKLVTEVHPATLPDEILLEQCRQRRTRRRGPGGQHRNKVETAVVLEHLPTGIRAEAAERRSQAANRAVAIGRLRVNLALEVRRRAASLEPSPLWRSRRTAGGTIRVAADHEDFPAILAEALDALDASDDDPAKAAKALGVTGSQLVKLLKKEPRALAAVNAGRQQRGLGPLR